MPRLDAELVARGLVKSRERAKVLISEGKILVNGKKAAKGSSAVQADDLLTLAGEDIPFVSRGGLKLQKALAVFPIDIKDKICCDVGASTGGFTDCMLQNGAKKVYAVDVGQGQLDESLIRDPRVIGMEQTNFRDAVPAMFPDRIDFLSCDVSFISLRLIFPAAYRVLKENGEAVFLVKPQFEAGREHLNKKGVVRDVSVQGDVLINAAQTAESIGFSVLGCDSSPITGPNGNREFLLYVRKCTGESVQINMKEIAKEAAALLG